MASCDAGSTFVTITTMGVDTSQVKALLVNATIDGAPVKQDLEFTNDLTMVGLRFDSAMQGSLAVTVDGETASKCVVQRGTVATYLGGEPNYYLTVVLGALPQKLCNGMPVDTVHVSLVGGSGTVISDPPGLSCSNTCSADFPVGSKVRLLMRPDASSAFVEWSGPCGGTGPCDLTLSGTVQVTANLAAKQCSAPSFCWDSPYPQGNPLRRLFGTSPSDLWAVGDGGTMLHWDGATWRAVPSGTSNDLLGVWGSDPMTVLAVGTFNTLLRWNGTAWSADMLPQQAVNLWVTAPNDVTAVGPAGTVQHYDGMSWTKTTSRTTNNLYSIWSAQGGEQWVVGQAGTVLHGNGKSWTVDPSGTFNDLYGVWAAGPTDIWAVGAAGTTRRRLNNGPWAGVNDPSGANLYAIRGTGLGDLFAVGAGGTIIRYDSLNVTFVTVPSPVTFDLYDVWGSGTSFWAVGDHGAILRYDGNSWQSENRVAPGFPGGLGLSAASATDAWVVGDRGAAAHWDGASWGPVPSSTSNRLTAVFDSGTDVWAVGDKGTVLHAAGGGALQTLPLPGPVSMANLSGVHGTPDGAVWIVGQGGVALRWVNGTFTTLQSGSLNNLDGVFGTAPENLWAVGDRGTILRWDPVGGKWGAVASGVAGNLYAVWGSGPGDMWAGGDGGTLLHWGGNSWAKAQSPTGVAIHGLWGSAAGDVWATGTAGTLLHWNGTAWAAVQSGTRNDLLQVGGSDKNTLWVTGTNSTILRYRPGS